MDSIPHRRQENAEVNLDQGKISQTTINREVNQQYARSMGKGVLRPGER